MKVENAVENGLPIEHFIAESLYAKRVNMRAGEVFQQHDHPHEHLSILAVGCVLVEQDGRSETIAAPACLHIPALTPHKVTAVEASVWYCVHSTAVLGFSPAKL